MAQVKWGEALGSPSKKTDFIPMTPIPATLWGKDLSSDFPEMLGALPSHAGSRPGVATGSQGSADVPRVTGTHGAWHKLNAQQALRCLSQGRAPKLRGPVRSPSEIPPLAHKVQYGREEPNSRLCLPAGNTAQRFLWLSSRRDENGSPLGTELYEQHKLYFRNKNPHQPGGCGRWATSSPPPLRCL